MKKTITKSRRLLGDVRLLAFLRWSLQAREEPRDILACTLVKYDLDEGETLDSIFVTGEVPGYLLHVQRLRPDTYRIEFGCQAGPEAGDGGVWEVVFTPEGAVAYGKLTSEWIS